MHDGSFVSQLASGSVGDAPFLYKNNQGSISDYCVDGERLGGMLCVWGCGREYVCLGKKEIYKKAPILFYKT